MKKQKRVLTHEQQAAAAQARAEMDALMAARYAAQQARKAAEAQAAAERDAQLAAERLAATQTPEFLARHAELEARDAAFHARLAARDAGMTQEEKIARADAAQAAEREIRWNATLRSQDHPIHDTLVIAPELPDDD